MPVPMDDNDRKRRIVVGASGCGEERDHPRTYQRKNLSGVVDRTQAGRTDCVGADELSQRQFRKLQAVHIDPPGDQYSSTALLLKSHELTSLALWNKRHAFRNCKTHNSFALSINIIPGLIVEVIVLEKSQRFVRSRTSDIRGKDRIQVDLERSGLVKVLSYGCER
ncbi:hypothetical protein DACRYDRAFT_111940 [Dacryopinax primogenitus]|uniref:Uncharacterized protein n=1 Tax=Dacryopinax primogenitus (strain DJM 731) TaxID=1858805 RepID=M5FPX9_DACPD|nr:uncharacterized protein DACRYDRAFT_111940 [Dacryopinax primogenitus]EJT97398.1 hypothetical protein DACRYDRAFT_111940 [Dacryopinax primogenitus]